MHEGVADNAVFKVFATIHMVGMRPGVEIDKIPFDMKTPLSQITKELLGS